MEYWRNGIWNIGMLEYWNHFQWSEQPLTEIIG